MKRKELRLIFSGILVTIGILGILGCWIGKRNKREGIAQTIETEDTFIVGKWKSTGMKVNGEIVQLDEEKDQSVLISLDISNRNQATLTYKGCTVIGTITQKDDKYIMDTDEEAMIELTIEQDQLLVNIIEKPLEDKGEDSFYWICDRIG